MPHTILAIPAFHDNYIWMIVHPQTQQAVVVDPGDAKPVSQVLAQQNLNLAAILITHHHKDHTGGVTSLYDTYEPLVFGPKEWTTTCKHEVVKEGDQIHLPKLELEFNVIDTPGHTSGHICFTGHEWLFCGDTLFAGGCGRLFEGTPLELYQSLQKLAALDPNTRVYCAHEYTAANLRFASVIDPENKALRERVADTSEKRKNQLPTIPSTIGLEKETNPFLRCHTPEIQSSVQNHYEDAVLADEVALFSHLRRWKDDFQD